MNRELNHYGVKGMHWGVRKDRYTGGTQGKKKKGLRLTPGQKRVAKNVAKTAAIAGISYYLSRNTVAVAIPASTISAGRTKTTRMLNQTMKSPHRERPIKLSEMTMDDLKAMDLW